MSDIELQKFVDLFLSHPLPNFHFIGQALALSHRTFLVKHLITKRVFSFSCVEEFETWLEAPGD